jgi:hypothetical protein
MQDHTTLNAQSAQQSQEVWKEIPGSNGRYEVSDFGRVRSWYYYKKWQSEPLYRKPFTSSCGYVYYRLHIGDKAKNYPAHGLVMSAFVGSSPMEPNHKNGDKSNNCLDNLEYMTHQQNIQHSFDVLGRAPTGKPTFETNRDKEIRRLASAGISQRQIARHFGVSQPYIQYIVSGKIRPPK